MCTIITVFYLLNEVILIEIHSKALLHNSPPLSIYLVSFLLILFDGIHSKGLIVKYQSEIFGIFWRSIANSITKTRVRAFNQMRWITVSVRWDLKNRVE